MKRAVVRAVSTAAVVVLSVAPRRVRDATTREAATTETPAPP